MDESSTDNSMALIVAAIEAQVTALSGMSVELIAEDLQKWMMAYKDDKGHVPTSMKLC